MTDSTDSPPTSAMMICHSHKPAAKLAMEKSRPSIEKSLRVVDTSDDLDLSLEDIDFDMLIVFGGDGMMLSSARRMGLNQRPMLGVNMGRLGYLCEIGIEDLETTVDDHLNGKTLLSHRMMMSTKISRKKNTDSEGLALNDTVLHRGAQLTMMTIKAYMDDQLFATYEGDGVVICTPTGSTGYSLSAGGPIISAGMDAFCLTPISAHTLASRPMMLPSDRKITLRVSRVNPWVQLSLDGQVHHAVNEDDTVEISRAGISAKLIETGKRTQFDLIREKLNW